MKRDQNLRQKKFTDKKRVELGPIQLNQEINVRQQKCRKRKVGEDPTNLKAQENNRKRLSLKRLRNEDHAKVKEIRTKGKLNTD